MADAAGTAMPPATSATVVAFAMRWGENMSCYLFVSAAHPMFAAVGGKVRPAICPYHVI
jgi:hypothetical protein